MLDRIKFILSLLLICAVAPALKGCAMYSQPWQDNDNDIKWEQHTSSSITVNEFVICEIAENINKRQGQFIYAYREWLKTIDLEDKEQQDLYHDPNPYLDDVIIGQHRLAWHITEHPEVIRKHLTSVMKRDNDYLFPPNFEIH